MSMTVGLVTGAGGQDGSYLTQLLLDKGYDVWGIVRNSSIPNIDKIKHLINNPNFNVRYGDIMDHTYLHEVISEILEKHKDKLKRFEIYNLAAQSHVQTSFEMPAYSMDVNSLGTLKLLDIIRKICPLDKTRFYQASTSELFGKVQEVPQKETTPFYPRSPYGVSKLYAFWIVKNYRESFGMFACNGILFNHDCATDFTPLIFSHDKKTIDIKPISEIVRYHTLTNGVLVDEKKGIYQDGYVDRDLYVWDKEGWTKVKFASGFKHDPIDKPKAPKFINAKHAVYMTTGEHMAILEDNSERQVQRLSIGDKLKLVDLPTSYSSSDVLDDFESEFIGLLVGDGYISHSNYIQFANKSEELRDYTKDLWKKICKKYNREYIEPKYYPSTSGFKPENIVGRLDFIGDSKWYLPRSEIYNEDKTKRIPSKILNSPNHIKEAFLNGYNKADGLKKNPCIYKCFKTNSQTLACGLVYLLKCTTGQDYNVTLEEKIQVDGETNTRRKFYYYSINILSDSRFSKTKSIEKMELVKDLLNKGYSQRRICTETQISRCFIRKIKNGYEPDGIDPKVVDDSSIKKIISYDDYEGWFYDLETESGTFMCGVGQGLVHNSPNRGPNFLTRKVTTTLGKILKGETDKLVVGNLEALRDMGYAKDYVEGMWRMLQHDVADDFILATGEMHSVREFIEKSFGMRGLDIAWKGSGLNEVGYDKKTGKEMIFIDPKFFRPAEVDQLLGDPTKAKQVLGWQTNTSFDELVKLMVDHDCPQN